MGKVYLARQLDLGRQVVVKVMHEYIASDPKFCERFQRETLLMARFQHPYAVTLYDASLNDPQGPCIIMEYVRGVNLEKLLQDNNGRLSPARVGRLLGQLCEVLQAAHNEGIVHRDLKPANLMIADPDTPYEIIKVMDFGLAKLMDAPKTDGVAGSGADFAVGTPTYICPEQVRGEAVDHRGDLYSVGVILYELLTGKTPFEGRSTMDILLAHATEAPPAFAEGAPGIQVPAAIETVVLACLAKKPGDRPASARDLAERFETALAHEEVVVEEATKQPDRSSPGGLSIPTNRELMPETNAVVHQLEAWMPEAIALHKLSGFMHDAGGEVVESVPGLIRVRLGGAESAYCFRNKHSSWFGRARRSGLIEICLRMNQVDQERQNLLHINVSMRSLEGISALDPHWRSYCSQIFCDLRGYLMGHNGAVKNPI